MRRFTALVGAEPIQALPQGLDRLAALGVRLLQVAQPGA